MPAALEGGATSVQASTPALYDHCLDVVALEERLTDPQVAMSRIRATAAGVGPASHTTVSRRRAGR
jgi:hypothetical protein